MSSGLVTTISVLAAIVVVVGFLLRRGYAIRQFARSRPKLSIHPAQRSVRHDSVITLKFWIKNESSLKHTLSRFTAAIKELPDSPAKVNLPDRKYRLPVELESQEPEKEFYILVDFSDPPSNDGVARTLVITGFCRWKGEEVEAGKCEVQLVSR